MIRKARPYLNAPALMFRRFRYKGADGQWQRKWKKRVIAPETWKVLGKNYDKDSDAEDYCWPA